MKAIKLKSTQDIDDIKKEAIELIQKSEYGKFIVICDIDDRTVIQNGNLSIDSALAQMLYAQQLMIHHALSEMNK